MAAILNSVILNSETAILGFSQLFIKNSQIHSNYTLTPLWPWLKLIHSDSTWWWQTILNSVILNLPSWIQPFFKKLWLKLIQSDSNSFILTQLDEGGHLEFWHVGFRHCHPWIQTPCYLLSDSLKSTLHSTLTLTQINSIWFKLDSFSAHLDDGCHLGFSHTGLGKKLWLTLI